ncbi:hypothetical protein [Actinokineospora xionganensis]|uniref:Ig-like domain-containing protein n=1 Tax=Actinokineospora xionganensis TaxID=2684470 RepID=A0ABR7LG24_9PSEU|nr:hypothetical protein [Actinokineospora xionganensis]MBC6451664.1 hypothetical protein [Actinokineospora xionganensis]
MNGTTARRLTGLLAAAAFTAVGCTSVQTSDEQGRAGTTPPPTETVTVTATDAAKPNGGSGGANNTTTRGTPPRTTTHHTTTTSKPPTGPVIVSFSVVQKPSCPINGTPDAPYSKEGVPVIIAWKINGADGAAIAVDNPTLYGAYGKDYPASGQLELSFPCSGTTGQTTHKYTVWPKDAKTISRTLTVSAQNNP